MRALVMAEGGPVLQRNWPEAAPSGEACVDLRLGGICATVLELGRGYLGFSGVLGEINYPCGTCATCHADRRTHCPEPTVLGIQGRHGAFRDRFNLPLANLHQVPDSVPDEAAVFVVLTATD